MRLAIVDIVRAPAGYDVGDDVARRPAEPTRMPVGAHTCPQACTAGPRRRCLAYFAQSASTCGYLIVVPAVAGPYAPRPAVDLLTCPGRGYGL